MKQLAYKLASSDFKKAIKDLPESLQANAEKIVICTDQLSKSSEHKDDIVFYTTVLHKTRKLGLDPDTHLYTYEYLAKAADKAPSFKKKISGGAIATAGAVAIGTYALTPPKPADSLFNSTTLRLVGVAGALALGAGICLFRSGKRKELSAEMMELVRSVKNLNAGKLAKGMAYAQAAFD